MIAPHRVTVRIVQSINFIGLAWKFQMNKLFRHIYRVIVVGFICFVAYLMAWNGGMVCARLNKKIKTQRACVDCAWPLDTSIVYIVFKMCMSLLCFIWLGNSGLVDAISWCCADLCMRFSVYRFLQLLPPINSIIYDFDDRSTYSISFLFNFLLQHVIDTSYMLLKVIQ